MVNARIHAPDRIERCEVTVKYRKRPVVIEAEVYKKGMEDGFDYEPESFAGEYWDNVHLIIGWQPKKRPYINTLEGKHYISEGDYIIVGIIGERYPCKPDIFKATYDKVLLACYSMIRERHSDIPPDQLNEEKYQDECLECEKTVKGQFILEWCRAYDRAKADGRTIKKMVVAIQLPTGAIELITNTDELQSKYHYYLSAYNDDMRLKTKLDIQLVGWMFV